MKIPEFVKVENTRNLTFMDVWKIYDNQFEILREFMMTLGDKYVSEEFTGSSSRVLSLNTSYSSGQLFLYINGVIQWKDKDYVETSSKSVTLLYPRKPSDIIMVVIVKSNIIRENIESYIDEIKMACDGSKESLERAQKLIASIEFLELELEQKREEFEKQRYLLSDFLSDFDSKYNNFVDNVEQQDSIRSEVESNANLVKGLHKEILTCRDDVESSREEVSSNTSVVVEAREYVEKTVSDVTELSERTTLDLEKSIQASEITSENLGKITILHEEILNANEEVKVNTSTVQGVTESVEATRVEVEENLAISETFLNEIRTIRKAIEDMGHLAPEEVLDSEIVLARNGAATIGTRLDDMVYKFETVEDIKQCRHLIDGDICLLIETSGKVFQVYRIITPGVGESIGDYSSTYYNIIDTSMYAYLLHDIMTMKGSGGSGTLTDVDFTEVYEKMSVLEDRVSVLENSAVGISVNEDSVIIDTGNTES